MRRGKVEEMGREEKEKFCVQLRFLCSLRDTVSLNLVSNISPEELRYVCMGSLPVIS